MAKTVIVLNCNLFLAPFVRKYAEILKRRGILFDIIYWNRISNNEPPVEGAGKTFVFDVPLQPLQSKLKKIPEFIKFARYVKKVVSENHYDRLILLNTSTALMLAAFLLFSYRGKYATDTRDYFMEKRMLPYFLEWIVFKKADLRVISSPAYKKFLPKLDYVLMHNETFAPSDCIDRFRKRERGGKIVIGQVGLIRFYNQNIALIKSFGNDPRFIIKFAGENSDSLKSYIKSNGINNVELVGKFPSNETFEKYSDVSLINNIYGNDISLDTAYSNKLYIGAKLGMPILASPNTLTAETVEKYGIGCSVNLSDKNMPDKIYNYFSKIDFDQFLHNCDKFLSDVNSDMQNAEKSIVDFLK
ncbi:MAG: hypothetical protein IJI37_03935 [Opitutales bacterium]|nr:hypothetical protein [Opitutales bacterium]